MGDFNDALNATLDAVGDDAERAEGEAPAPPKQDVAPPAKASAPAPVKEPPVVVSSRPVQPAREIVMPPSPASAPDARWRVIMQSDDKPDIELQRERRKHNQCPVCGLQAPRIGRTSAPQLHYCTDCSFPFHVYSA